MIHEDFFFFLQYLPQSTIYCKLPNCLVATVTEVKIVVEDFAYGETNLPGAILSLQDDIVNANLSLRSVFKISLKTVAQLVWFNTDHSSPVRLGHRLFPCHGIA